MITNNSIQAKEEEAKNEGRSLGCSSRQWSRLRNPRIVRVPRSFGGKDRHSKVCTVRGLRDRRIRLSVPTALELYHLQDKLGLNQPSKVVDWLLDATKEDINKLPPLQIPPGFNQFHHQQVVGPSRNLIGDLLLPYESNPYQFSTNTCSLLSKQGGLRINDGKFWDMKSKQVMNDEKGKSAAQSFFPTNAILPYSSYNNHYENSNLLSLQPQSENFFNPNSMSLPSSSSSLALPSGSHHLYMCPTTLFPSYPSYFMPPTNEAADTGQVNHFQLLNNAAAAAAGPSLMPASRYFQANVMNSKYLHRNNDQTQSSDTRGELGQDN